MNYKYDKENNVLTVNSYVFERIRENKSAQILVSISSNIRVNQGCLQESMISDFSTIGSEPQYPVFLLRKEKKKLLEQFKELDIVTQDEKMYCEQLMCFWKFCGDGTHYSEYIPTPYMFKPKQTIYLSNSVKVSDNNILVKITEIDIVSDENGQWFWNIRFN